MIDQNINKTIKEFSECLNPIMFPMGKIQSHMDSLTRDISDLRKSRDSWRLKYEELSRLVEQERNIKSKFSKEKREDPSFPIEMQGKEIKQGGKKLKWTTKKN